MSRWSQDLQFGKHTYKVSYKYLKVHKVVESTKYSGPVSDTAREVPCVNTGRFTSSCTVRVWEGLKLPVEELQPRNIYFGVVLTVTCEQNSIWPVTLGLPRERLVRID